MRPEARAVIARKCVEAGAHLVEIDEEWRLDEKPPVDGCYSAIATPANKNSVGALSIAPPLPGRFQIRNALAAATAARNLATRGLHVTDQAIESGIANVQLARTPGTAL